MKWTMVVVATTAIGAANLRAQEPPPPPATERVPEVQPRPRIARRMNPMRMQAYQRGGRLSGPHGMGVPNGLGPAGILERRDVLGLSEEQVSRLKALESELKGIHERAQEVLTPEQRGRVRGWMDMRPRRGPRPGGNRGLMSRRPRQPPI